MNKNYIFNAFIGLVVMATAQPVLAKTANITTISPASGTLIQTGVPQTIRWTSSDYPIGTGVNINLLRQFSSNPDKFEFVKTIRKDTPNDSQEIWIPSVSDAGNNLVVQVSCSLSYVFPEGCLSSNGNAQLSVVNKAIDQSYTASILSSISETLNKISDLIMSMFR